MRKFWYGGDYGLKKDIVEVISKYVDLKRNGSSYAGRCPFHHTNTFDAFRISPKLQIFKCFNCGVQGDAISFIMKIERVSFNEALKILEINEFKPIKKKKERTASKPPDKSKPILNQAAEFWKNNLTQSKEAIEYLNSRGINDRELIKRLNIGFSEKGGLAEHFLSSGYKEDYLLQENLIKKGDYGIYDFFRNRIMFPVYNQNREISTITSRSIEKDQKLKHLHMPGSMETFYNEPEIDGSYIIIVEGIFDCLSLLQEGFKAIAIYGTGGLKKSMAMKLKKTFKIYLAFDKEENGAGQKGLERSLEIFKEAKITNIYPINLPYMEGRKIDINDLFSKHDFTKEDFAELMEDASGRKICVNY